ncbi:MAG: hypothetical protein KIS92_26410, partial [Planctomycetota bacterium]|nr:hypothetical protein [Planctomycetota bacterium]
MPLDESRDEPDGPPHGTLTVAACAAFLVNLFLAGAIFYRIYRLQEENLASIGQVARNGAYVLAHLASGVCLLYLLLALRRFDALYQRLAGPRPDASGPESPEARGVWFCTVPLLAVGGTLLVSNLLRAQYDGLPHGSWDPARLVLAAYLILAGLCAEGAVRVLRRAEAAGRTLAGEAAARRERALFWAVTASAGLRLGGMGYFLWAMLADEVLARQASRVLGILDHALSLATVAAATVAFGVLARIWGDG